MSVRAVVGLGNAGPEYARTRHNLGFRVVEAVASECEIALKKKRAFWAWWGRGSCWGHSLLLVKPAASMNLSGLAVKKVMDYFRLRPPDLLVVVDDVSLPPGRLRLRPLGGAGGHHGLESIIAEIQSRDFPRLRLGIGGAEKIDLTGHVLSPASVEEERLIAHAVESAVRLVREVLDHGLEAAMSRFN